MKTAIKLIIWYSVPAVILLGMIQATMDLLLTIIFNFATLTVGLAVGLLLKERFLKRPWLIVLVPIFYFILGMFGIV